MRVPAWMQLLAIVSLLLLGGVILALSMSYENLPVKFPTHYGLNGEADAFRPKSAARVFVPPVIGLIVAGLMWFNTWAIAKSSNIARPTFAMGIMAIMGLLTSLLMTIISATPLLGDQIPGGGWLMGAIVVAILIVGIGGSLKWNAFESVGETSNEGWHGGGLFYYNKSDPSLMVAKRIGIGITVNFAHKGALVFVVAMVAILGCVGVLIADA